MKDGLRDRGYFNIYWADEYNASSIPSDAWSFRISLETLELREFKVKEYLSDSTSGTTKTVKLKGIETTGKAAIVPFKNNTSLTEFLRYASCNKKDEESQEGQFATTVGLGDLIRKDKDGSVKYDYQVNEMSQEIFFKQIESVARELVLEIDTRLIDVYRKASKQGVM